MLQKTKVVMLPTNKASDIYLPLGIVKANTTYDNGSVKGITKDNLYINKNPEIPKDSLVFHYYEPQHLYFLSDEEIKEGDWAISTPSNKPYRVGVVEYAKQDKDKKIIATTDLELIAQGVPKIRERFITKYVELYNKGQVIEYSNVEYAWHLNSATDKNNWVLLENQYINKGVQEFYGDRMACLLKLDKEGCVITHAIQDNNKMYTREEFLEGIKKYECERLKRDFNPIYAEKWFNKNY